MSLGLNHFVGETNLGYSNITNGHSAGNFTDPKGAVTGCGSYPSPNVNVRENSMVGGEGYGFSIKQDSPGNHLPDFSVYKEGGYSSPDNLNASKQYSNDSLLPSVSSFIGGKGRKKRGYVHKGGSSNTYYELDVQNGDTRLFAGSGYPPISTKSQNLLGGRKMKHKSRKSRKLHKRSTYKVKSLRRYRNHHHSRYCKHSTKGRRVKRRGTKKRKLGLGGKMSSKLFKNLIGGKNMTGGYHQFMGDQPFSQGYGIGSVTPGTSALANPIPFTPYNHCSDNK